MPKKIRKDFSSLKTLASKEKLNFQFNEDKRAYSVFISDESGTSYQSNIYKSSYLEEHRVIGIDTEQNAIDEADFLANYKTAAEESVVQKPKTDSTMALLYQDL